jgi:hypothetical protein
MASPTMPIGPPIACALALELGAEAMDRAAPAGGRQAAVGAHLGANCAQSVGQRMPGRQDAELDDGAERDARLGAFAARQLHRRGLEGHHGANAACGRRGVAGVAFDAEPTSAKPARNRAGRARAKERIKDEVAEPS